jgi:protein-tyrosine phosphatase
MGNICRSPTAEGVFRKLVQERAPHLEVEIDSAGTHGYHVGDPPDRRAIAAAARRGVDLGGLRARTVEDADFETFDLLVAMDQLNREVLVDRSPDEYRERINWRLSSGVYVVLRPLDLPDGLAGANARAFILPTGAARGTDSEGRHVILFCTEWDKLVMLGLQFSRGRKSFWLHYIKPISVH